LSDRIRERYTKIKRWRKTKNTKDRDSKIREVVKEWGQVEKERDITQ
jgi:hypothetical protein